ncbi:MAG: respiratory nitrate reductase subunit gamma [bacterium JZ-2024 1]
MINNFFFVALPYISIVFFFGGVIYRMFSGFKGWFRGKWDLTVRGDFLWTTRSTGFFSRTTIGPAALSLHWGIIILFFTHIIGFIGGAYHNPTLVNFFRWVGMFGGILFFYGVLWALIRRFSIPQIRAMSTVEDYLVLILLLVISGLGLYQSAVKLIFGISYSVGPWMGSILTLRPDPSLIARAPLLNKLHIIIALIFFAYFPFTKLVHAITFPIDYAWRPYITFRKLSALKR